MTAASRPGLSRTTRYKILHIAFIAATLAAVVGALLWADAPPLVALAVGVAFLLPGRVQAILWRRFFRARRLLGEGRYEEAIDHFQAFLEQLERAPWLKSLVWLAGAVYTRDIEVMSLNNIGAAQLQLGDWTQAADYLQRARDRDPDCPLPYWNLALLAQAQGDEATATRHLERAHELGYRRSSLDQLIHSAGALLARVEGRGS